MGEDRYDVIVVGAGHNGLTAAAYLAPRSVFDRAFDAYQTVGWKPIAADVDVGPLV